MVNSCEIKPLQSEMAEGPGLYKAGSGVRQGNGQRDRLTPSAGKFIGTREKFLFTLHVIIFAAPVIFRAAHRIVVVNAGFVTAQNVAQFVAVQQYFHFGRAGFDFMYFWIFHN